MISNEELLNLVIRDKAAGKVSDELAAVWVEMANRQINRRYIKRLTYHEDLVSEALDALCILGLSFNPTVSDNPYVFFTNMIKGALLCYMSRQRKMNLSRKILMAYNILPNGEVFDDSTKKYINDLKTLESIYEQYFAFAEVYHHPDSGIRNFTLPALKSRINLLKFKESRKDATLKYTSRVTEVTINPSMLNPHGETTQHETDSRLS